MLKADLGGLKNTHAAEYLSLTLTRVESVLLSLVDEHLHKCILSYTANLDYYIIIEVLGYKEKRKKSWSSRYIFIHLD